MNETVLRQRHPSRLMVIRFLLLAALLAPNAFAQAPPIDTSGIGPQVGAVVPPVAGVDQFGNQQTLASISGPKGAMLVFFRSADW